MYLAVWHAPRCLHVSTSSRRHARGGEGTGRQEHRQGEERPPPVRRERRGIISFRSSGWIKWMRAVRDECGSVAAMNVGENSMPSPPLKALV